MNELYSMNSCTRNKFRAQWCVCWSDQPRSFMKFSTLHTISFHTTLTRFKCSQRQIALLHALCSLAVVASES